MCFEEFQTEIEWWGAEVDDFAAREETEQAWKVGIDNVVARNYNLDLKNPHEGEQIVHDPEELLDDSPFLRSGEAGTQERGERGGGGPFSPR